jgi:tRNA dimethylallyltransferase
MSLRVLVLVGPTAGGKTQLGVQVASELGSEIISADSRQVYRGLDIGTGKDLDEYRAVTPAVRHHLIDVADAETVYSLFDYQRDCYRVLESKASEPRYAGGVPLILVGGTGLYVEAVLRGYRIADVPENPALRDRLAEQPHHLLVQALDEADPELASRTDRDNTRRVIRALEIADHAKRHTVRTSQPPSTPIEYSVFALDIPADEIARRIDRRLASRMDQGLIPEVEGLIAGGLPVARLEQLGLEYREVAYYLSGKKSRETMLHDLGQGIRRFAKRQRTWFRGFARRGVEVTWVQPDDKDRLLKYR